ncbi:MAG: hypothetical protein QM706_13630 [Nitrospira sp.]
MVNLQTIYDKLRGNRFVVLTFNEPEEDADVRDHITQYGHTFPDRNNKGSKSVRGF